MEKVNKLLDNIQKEKARQAAFRSVAKTKGILISEAIHREIGEALDRILQSHEA